MKTLRNITKIALLALIGFVLVVTWGYAEVITASSATGIGGYYHDPNLLIDNVFPDEGSAWNGVGNVYWYHNDDPVKDERKFTIDLGGLYYVEDISLSVDNNDDYTVEYSRNMEDWSHLITVLKTYGEIGNGMDTMSTVDIDPEYVVQIDFDTAVESRYLRMFHVREGGDSYYAAGELQAWGSPVPIPEPATMLLLGSGLIGLAGARRKFKK